MKQPHILVYGQGYPLVLFHGWGFDTQIWFSLLPALSSDYQVFLVDLPGFGLTKPMAWEAFKSQLLEQLPSTFSLIGWSMGGLMATRLAIEEPSRISHLVNIASSPRFIQEPGWPGIDQTIFNAFHQELAINPGRTLNQFIQLQLQGQSRALGHLPSSEGLQLGLELLMASDLRTALKTLKLPVCYMFGRLDTIVPRRTQAIMLEHYPNIHYVIFSKAAHAPFLSHPDEFMTALEGFLK